jgi:hypothetical protein
MINEKLRKLITLLTVKTQKKEAVWNKASGNDQFTLLLPDNIAVTISQHEGDYNNPVSYNVAIYNSNGDVIQRYITDENTPEDDVQLLNSFHQSASDVYYKVDETFDSLIRSVQSVGTIGTKEIEKTDIADDLPF